LTISSSAAGTMRAAVRHQGNSEACGLLFGTGSMIVEASVARNVAAEPWHRFEIDPAHLFDAHRRSRSGPLRLIGCWHSHPDGMPEPSRIDREGVSDDSWLWLILAGDLITCWRPVAGGFQQLVLEEVQL
jgi:desampylase